jgi:hypothetical protein
MEGIKGKLMLIRTVADLPGEQLMQLLGSVAGFNQFTPGNDPHKEHDCATITLFGQRWIWKIDYYDEEIRAFGNSVHVLLIIRADEY